MGSAAARRVAAVGIQLRAFVRTGILSAASRDRVGTWNWLRVLLRDLDFEAFAPIASRDIVRGSPPGSVRLPSGIAQQGIYHYYALAEVVRFVRPRRVFEIGTSFGLATLTIALNAPDAEILTLDLPSHGVSEAMSVLDERDQRLVDAVQGQVGVAFQKTPVAERITQLFGNSLMFDFSPYTNSCDLVFVDGGHSKEHIESDTQHALRLVRDGGVILWDDYSWLYPSVPAYLNRLAETLPLVRIPRSAYVMTADPRPPAQTSSDSAAKN